MTADLDALCEGYVRELDGALVNLSPEDRKHIVEQVTEHISSARAALPYQSEEGVRQILERLGAPEEIAAEAGIENQPRGRRRLSAPVLIVAGFVLIMVGVGLAAAMGAFVGEGATHSIGRPRTTATVAIPHVVGSQIETAQAILFHSGLKIRVKGVISKLPTGSVMRESPPAGEEVRRGASVVITVAGYGPKVTVPNVIGVQILGAMQTMGEAGVNVRLKGLPNDQPTNVVRAQSPAGGTIVRRGTIVALTGSTNLPSKIVVPNVIGLQVIQAQQSLESVGLDSKYHPAVSNPHRSTAVVTAQDLSAGSVVKAYSVVTLTVRASPKS